MAVGGFWIGEALPIPAALLLVRCDANMQLPPSAFANADSVFVSFAGAISRALMSAKWPSVVAKMRAR